MAAARAYFDTSVVAQRYVHESGASFARAVLRRHRCVSSAILPLEVMSALCRRREAGDLAPRDFALIEARVSADRERWDLVEVTAAVLTRGEQVVQHTPLRTLEAIHLASALVVREAGAEAALYHCGRPPAPRGGGGRVGSGLGRMTACFHVLDATPAAHALVDRWLADAPARLRLVVASRTRPPLRALPRLLVEGEGLVLDRAALAFRPDEARALLAGSFGLLVSEEQARELASGPRAGRTPLAAGAGLTRRS